MMAETTDSSILTVLIPGLPHIYNIFMGHIPLNIMHRGKNKTATRSQVFNSSFCFVSDLLWGSAWQDRLGVATASPYRYIFAKVPLEFVSIHTMGAHLPGIKDINPTFNQVRQDVGNGSAAVEEDVDLVFGPGFNEFNQLFMAGLDIFAIHLWRNEQAFLGSQVIRFSNQKHVLSGGFQRLFPVLVL